MAKPSSSKGLGVKIEVEKGEVAAAQRAYAAHLRDVELETARAAERHARSLVTMIRATAAGKGRQAALAAQSVRYAGSRPPTIAAGGGGTVHPSRSDHLPSGGDVFFGSEFGGSAKRWPARRKGGYWYFPTVTVGRPRLRRAYETALERAARRWGTGG